MKTRFDIPFHERGIFLFLPLKKKKKKKRQVIIKINLFISLVFMSHKNINFLSVQDIQERRSRKKKRLEGKEIASWHLYLDCFKTVFRL